MVTTPIEPHVEQESEADRCRRVIDLILDKLTIEAIRQLIEEIEAEIARRSNESS